MPGNNLVFIRVLIQIYESRFSIRIKGSPPQKQIMEKKQSVRLVSFVSFPFCTSVFFSRKVVVKRYNTASGGVFFKIFESTKLYGIYGTGLDVTTDLHYTCIPSMLPSQKKKKK